MSPLDPLQASQRIHDEYRRYLKSTFPLRRPAFADAFAGQLDGTFPLSRGPILQSSPPYEPGATVRDLVGEGVLSQRFLRLREDQFPLDRPLHSHQERAIRKAVEEQRNLVVATGTGSGKTECFLLPILDGLLKESEEGTLSRPGVRALLLYPMNALANDQLKRLRTLLSGLPAVTFGRYVGETKATQSAAQADFRTRHPSEPLLPNELISREVMQERPPHILLTNYAMLEYLLLRPEDSSLFDGSTSERWRYLALDEVHVYGGAQGTEVAMLLRRLRDRVNRSERGRLQCFGTSATLGRGERDYLQLVEFAEALFDEPFKWDPDDPGGQDVIGAVRRSLVRGEARSRLGDDEIRELREAARVGPDRGRVAAITGMQASSDEPLEATLSRGLSGDERVIALQRLLEDGSIELEEVARELFGPGVEGRRRLVELVDLCVMARERPGDAPLLPARYHFFLRALEGAFVCLHPDHDDREPALRLARHERCPSCARRQIKALMFELGVCRRCGGEYLVGAYEGTHLRHASPQSPNPVRALLGQPLADDEDDEDQDVLGRASDKAVAAALCPSCGELDETGDPKCGCGVRPVRAWLALDAKEDGALRRCIACGHRPGGDPVYRFLTGLDAPVSVIATDLYQEIPASLDPSLADEIGQGRKLLVFSDSRQDAAFFAPFLERTYRRAVQRRLIAQALDAFGDEAPRAGDLVGPVVKRAEGALVLDPDDGSITNRLAASNWLMRELLAMDRRQSLEGTGVADIRLALPRRCAPPAQLLALGFTADEALDLIRMLLDTIRNGGALEMLEGVDVRAEEFSPRNREISIRGQASAYGVLAWSPAKALNARLDVLRRILERKEIAADPKEILVGIWRMLTEGNGPWQKLFAQTSGADGPLWRLQSDRFEFSLRHGESPLRCSRCAQLWWRTVAGVCPSFRCDGTLSSVEDRDALLKGHYARLYRDLEPVGMAVEEHTAQWQSMKASSIQDEFVAGRVNVLSCSTTFELGVDVGDVQAVLLRNVPPSPANYVQRAGRAGRRTDSAALVVTFAQRRSHDLTFFADPHSMVDGMIPAPRVVLNNTPIIRRHLHSLAFAAFQREVGGHKTVEDFFASENGPTRDAQFITWLRTRPSHVGEAAGRVIPVQLHDRLGLPEWTWVEALVDVENSEASWGWLRRAATEIREDMTILQTLIEEAAEEEKFGRANQLKRLRTSILRRNALNYLASRNILPKYGFPVDVVELNLARSGDETASNLELNRDLALAIADYAPGAVTVAGKKQWRSVGLIKRADREWPQYEWVRCKQCDAFRHGLIEAPLACPTCGSEEHATNGRFVMPIWGFAGVAAESPGETRPLRRNSMETFFGSYRDVPPELEEVAGVALRRRFSHQGKITIVNKGPLGRGFRVCEWCGFGQPVQGTKAPASHKRIDRPDQGCGGRLAHLHLGHEYLTDVLELQITTSVPFEDMRSALYAILEAVPALDVARDEVDGTLHLGAVGAPSFVLFDAVPGGAGNVQRLGKDLRRLLEIASDRVATCECGEETSCYSCLRGYRNQIWHDELSRRAAIGVLDALRMPARSPH